MKFSISICAHFTAGILPTAERELAAYLAPLPGCSALSRHDKRYAMVPLGTTPQQSRYVGDIYSIDFLGAQRVGMGAILMDLAGTHRQTVYPRVESLAELECCLEGG